MRMMGKQLDDSISKIAGIYAWRSARQRCSTTIRCAPRPALYGIAQRLEHVVTAYEDGTLTKLSDLGQKLETSTGVRRSTKWFPGLARPS